MQGQTVNANDPADIPTTDRRPRLPRWIRAPRSGERNYPTVSALLRDLRLNTVCQDARCPNRGACWAEGTATFMILGAVCTRACRFCAVTPGNPSPPDPDEPERVAEAAQRMGLRYVVVTSVTRDDLPDGGAERFAATLHALRARLPEAGLEVLIPDFMGSKHALDVVLDARPTVLNHNLETVRRLQPRIRPQADYARSLGVLRHAARRRETGVKSGLMLGLGETDDEALEALGDLRAAGCDRLTLGQYLQPAPDRQPVDRFVPPERFAWFGEQARAMGFNAVASGPMVRSSYHAEAQATGTVC